ncbi:hypothetical protein DWX55_06010 [Collinsella sp. AF19-7AC]|uniref:hypothetical protein n=1 Tax=unclassified Collinsella TaxID=2637548 RepID=UPI000E4D0D60|nr:MULTISPECIES: hypothetical protein [unclassified Collinsella]RGT04181.1 hypothetical protein DWX55_06010 [Collinsella sp. AF19-7AC]RGT30563.1 hypothetical protein DWX39_06145 [Collinsella sp. AF19-1LB]RHE27354.1 hypothetical protein DW754_06290 [Collinsella sp. AM29-10AC]RHL25385.1 hypothetical protein DW029_02830 [Collinsella sp. AF38-3AC]
MNEQDNIFERTEQQVLFYLYENRDHTVSRAELRENINTAPVESTFESILTSLKVKKLIEFDPSGNVAIA